MRTFICSLVIVVLLLLSQTLPILSENQENEAKILLASWGRRLAGHGDSNPSDHGETLRVFMRKVRSGGFGKNRRRSRRRVRNGGSGGSSATSRPCLSIAFRFGSAAASSVLLMIFL
ncbi:hypothetical protein EUTSA_v10026598mg [Eutrema salsugineum]|uniref:Uncharacterized protein n=1 Tax=Eutrema salsugineum TaxID=72664 RepID=V4LU34_EUTSA|nr:uncharacterized protein LOC18031007 [Eutrema salsugineum]ESQ54130.1 hypothetical protein EUTSA_v10026598mg [Eutrema salsugineum]